MCKVAVIGNAGGGKSTMCKRLSEAKDLPFYAVDKIQWGPNWTPVPKPEVNESLNKLCREDFWIIDGWGSWQSIEERFAAADTIVFIDHAVWVHFWWAIKRQFKAFLFPSKVDTPHGCKLSKVTWKLFRMIWMIHKKSRPRLQSLIDNFKAEKTVYHIRSPRELRSFLLYHC